MNEFYDSDAANRMCAEYRHLTDITHSPISACATDIRLLDTAINLLNQLRMNLTAQQNPNFTQKHIRQTNICPQEVKPAKQRVPEWKL